ncbi:MAG: hypothetical protein Q3979_01075 [Actinomycetaceae bacterium]|nr:hypothetical protein [Actinomycetaceae bacterium]
MTHLFRLVRLPDSARPTRLHEALAGLSRDRSLELLGNLDYASSAAEIAANMRSAYHESIRVLVMSDDAGTSVARLRQRLEEATLADLFAMLPYGDTETPTGTDTVATRTGADAATDTNTCRAVAHLTMTLPSSDNTHVGEFNVHVRREFEGLGLIELLVDLGGKMLRELGRTHLQYWSEHARWDTVGAADEFGGPVGAPGQTSFPHILLSTPIPGTDDRVRPRPDAVSACLAERGFSPVHSEWLTVLDVDAALEATARPVEGYELVTFTSPQTPPELREELARIYALASTDMPSGEMSVEPEVWDAERVACKDERARRAGHDWIITAVRPVGGELVGWTHLVLPRSTPRAAMQEGTLIRADHGRRGLASWIKRANLAAMKDAFPKVERIMTFNDGDNRAVIAMNQRLGFAPRLMTVGWEKKIEGAGGGARRVQDNG